MASAAASLSLNLDPLRRVALLHGSDVQRQRLTAAQGTIHHRGSTDVHLLLGPVGTFKEFHVTPNYFRRAARFALGEFDTLFNIVADPDINPATLGLMTRIVRGYRGRVVNPPDRVARLTRDGVARRLAGIDGLEVPPVARLRFVGERALLEAAARAGVTPPVILRPAGTHNGHVIGLFDRWEDLLPRLERGTTYYLTRFTDYASARDGLYRKWRFFFFGQAIVVRHQVISDHWNVHVSDRARLMLDRPDLIEEERLAVEGGAAALTPSVQAVLEAVRARIGLDYFGLDCGVDKEGRVVLFEANPAMSFLGKSAASRLPHVEAAFPRGRAALRDLLLQPPPPR